MVEVRMTTRTIGVEMDSSTNETTADSATLGNVEDCVNMHLEICWQIELNYIQTFAQGK